MVVLPPPGSPVTRPMPRRSRRWRRRTSSSVTAVEAKRSSTARSLAKGWRARPKCLRYTVSPPSWRGLEAEALGLLALHEAVAVDVDHLGVLGSDARQPPLHQAAGARRVVA